MSRWSRAEPWAKTPWQEIKKVKNKRVPAEMVFVRLSALHTPSSHAEKHAQSGIASLSVSLPLTK